MRSNVHQGHVARKRFGQNFLVDDGIIHGIVGAIDPQPRRRGGRDRPRPRRADQPAARAPAADAGGASSDRDLVDRLRRRYGDRLGGMRGDALAVRLRQAASRPAARCASSATCRTTSPARCCFHLMDFADQVRDQHFVLPEGSGGAHGVPRPAARPSGACRSCSQVRYHMEHVLDVPPALVQSAAQGRLRRGPHDSRGRGGGMAGCARRTPPATSGVLGDVVTAAFSQRRKVLRNTLSFPARPGGLRQARLRPGPPRRGSPRGRVCRAAHASSATAPRPACAAWPVILTRISGYRFPNISKFRRRS